MAWLLVLGTIPVGIVGLVFEHNLRTVFAKPTAAAIFLTLNGVILLAGERLRRRGEVRKLVMEHDHHTDPGHDVGRDLDTLELREGAFVGLAQILALFAGISRSGVTMVAGLLRGLDHEDAARFSFMLATPVILAAGVYKLPDLPATTATASAARSSSAASPPGIAAYIVGPVPHPLLRDPHAHAVRDLQPRLRHRDDRLPQRLTDDNGRSRTSQSLSPRRCSALTCDMTWSRRGGRTPTNDVRSSNRSEVSGINGSATAVAEHNVVRGGDVDRLEVR